MKLNERGRQLLVWLLRLTVGVLFIISGLSKMLDPWGFIFKIEDYQALWGWAIPRTINLTGAIGLSAFEFITGLMLATGCYRRAIPRLMLACMCFMLPLTFYIWIKDPVSDCGCFGEFWVISNFATFAKNVAITAMLIFLLKSNHLITGLYDRSIQWVACLASGFYIVTIGLMGYLIQPLVDFRPYPEGNSIINESSDDDLTLIYERDGIRREFPINNLPDDDSWIFVGRNGDGSADSMLAIFNPEDGEDVTEEVLDNNDPLLLLVMSEPLRADLSDTYAINELNEAITRRGGHMAALLATDADGIARWLDLSMGTYPCYEADDTQLKELVRGVMSLVYVSDGTIAWKRTISSINLDQIDEVVEGKIDIESLRFDGHGWFARLSIALGAILSVLYVGQCCVTVIARHRRRTGNLKNDNKSFSPASVKSEKSCVNLQSESTTNNTSNKQIK